MLSLGEALGGSSSTDPSDSVYNHTADAYGVQEKRREGKGRQTDRERERIFTSS